MHPQSTGQISPDAPRDWHFTFGAGQRFAGHYVTIHGTDAEARAEMIRRFRAEWCAMYDATRPVEVTKFPTELTELPRAQWPDPARPTVLTFGVFGLPEARLAAGEASPRTIVERISDELDSAGYDLDLLTIRFDDGGMSVTVLDSDNFPLGTVTISQPELDYWLTLAAELRQAADRFATLAGKAIRPGWTSLSIRCGSHYQHGEPEAIALVDQIAAAFGTTAEVGQYGTTGHYQTIVGSLDAPLQVRAHTYPPFGTDPRDAEIHRLRAELAAAQGGGAR